MAVHAFKAYRQRHGVSQKVLGVAMGISIGVAQARISHYESGRRLVPVAVAYSFLELALSLGEVVSLEDVYPRDEFLMLCMSTRC